MPSSLSGRLRKTECLLRNHRHPQFPELTPTKIRVLHLLYLSPGLTEAEAGIRLWPKLGSASLAKARAVVVLEAMRLNRLVSLKYEIPVRFFVSRYGYEALAACGRPEFLL